ncbi:uncharacterized protein LOC144373648 isoform X1 [Ictidomys tridecemlineatus]
MVCRSFLPRLAMPSSSCRLAMQNRLHGIQNEASRPGARPRPGASTRDDIPATGYLITLTPTIPCPCCHASLELFAAAKQTPHMATGCHFHCPAAGPHLLLQDEDAHCWTLPVVAAPASELLWCHHHCAALKLPNSRWTPTMPNKAPMSLYFTPHLLPDPYTEAGPLMQLYVASAPARLWSSTLLPPDFNVDTRQ